MPRCPDLPPIDSTVQFQTITFDFGTLIQRNYPPGTTLAGTPTVTCTVAEGTDTNPGSRLITAPVIGTAPLPYGSGVVDGAVFIQVGNCLGSVTYLLECVCSTSTGDIPSLWGHLPCVTPR